MEQVRWQIGVAATGPPLRVHLDRKLAGPLCTAILGPSVISRGAPCQAKSEISVSEEWKRARNVLGILPASSDFHNKLQGSLTCRKSATWDRPAEDFSPEKSDGFGRVRTRDLGYQRPAC
jgi:hypothetical protein